MATNNAPYQVLVTIGDQAILAINNRVENLAVGQLGIFNLHTGLSVSAASPIGDMQDLFIAVGLNKLGSGGGATLEDINKSAGQMIQTRNLKSWTIQPHLTALPKIVDIDSFSVPRCETNYSIKIEYRNSKIYALNGYNQFTKTYVFTTGCCADQCTDCGTSDCAALVVGLAAAINADPDVLSTATFYGMKIVATINGAPTADGNTTVTVGTTDYVVAVLDADTAAQTAAKIVTVINNQASSPYRASAVGAAITIYAKTVTTGSTATFAVAGSGVTANAITAATKTAITDTAAYITAYPGACLGLRITSNPLTAKTFQGGVNPLYEKLRDTDMIVSLVSQDDAGFTCSGSVVTNVQDLRSEQGEGYDLQQLEYIAGGWNGKPGPYRVSDTTGLARSGYEFYAVKGTKYTIMSIMYDQMSVGGWVEYLNNLETIIAIPCASTTTLIGLVAVLTAAFAPRFSTMVADVASMDCTNVEAHTTNDPALDGIESIG